MQVEPDTFTNALSAASAIKPSDEGFGESDGRLRQLFCFWEFNGDNSEWCNQHCPYCYAGPVKKMQHRWIGGADRWSRAFERLDRDIYFNLSYGEPMGGNGFYEVIDVIGDHANWECSIITNLSYSPQRLLETKLAKDRRLYVHASWHPLGGGDWETFRKHLLMLQDADIPIFVMYLFYPPQIERWKEYWKWLDAHNIRTYVRRFVGYYDGKLYPFVYSPEIRNFLYATVQPKTRKYGIDLHDPHGNICTAGKDMILVHYDGSVGLCADAPQTAFRFNIFDEHFRLKEAPVQCPRHLCGGDYGLLHMYDPKLPNELPPDDSLWHDCFIAQTEKITGGGKQGPVQYPNRAEMEKWLHKLD